MFSIKEVANILGNRYYVFLDEIKIKEIYIKRIKRERKGYEYLFLIDSKGAVIEEVFKYLNYKCNIKSINGREQAQSALKLLYSFKEIINKEFQEFNLQDISNLSNFLLGISISGNYMEIHNINTRTISSHNIYFDAIRKYLSYVDVDNKFFFQKVNISNDFNEMNYNQYPKKNKYKTNIGRHGSFTNNAPKYISVHEYKRIIDYLDFKCDESVNVKRDRAIINLMFLFGLRIGEVLGITMEDIKDSCILIRNRLSDKGYQKAKTCFSPRDKNDYKSKMYKLKDRGFQKIHIVSTITDEISEYIDSSRDILELSHKKINKIIERSKADSVESDDENYYVFLSKNGNPISISGWNKRLKEIYLNCGIAIDIESKKINLNHRLRHGYAMNLKQNLNMNPLFIKKKMRQRSLSSTEKYFNPTDEDIIAENSKIIDSINEIMKRD